MNDNTNSNLSPSVPAYDTDRTAEGATHDQRSARLYAVTFYDASDFESETPQFWHEMFRTTILADDERTALAEAYEIVADEEAAYELVVRAATCDEADEYVFLAYEGTNLHDPEEDEDFNRTCREVGLDAFRILELRSRLVDAARPAKAAHGKQVCLDNAVEVQVAS